LNVEGNATGAYAPIRSVSIRDAEERDAAALARVTVETWRYAYAGSVPEQYLRGLDEVRIEREWVSRTGGIVADHSPDGVVGFVQVGRSRDPALPAAGEIIAIYVLPTFWGRGVGRSLMDAGLQRLATEGFRDVLLWVLADNKRAQQFYAAAGWSSDGGTKEDISRGFPIVEVRYRFRQKDK
jgi:ribosomal protein S18 acetylase RimI-like enzyme